MKTIQRMAFWLVVITSLAQTFLFYGCEPEEFVSLPQVLSVSCENVTDNTATIFGNAISDGGAPILDLGVILGTNVISLKGKKNLGSFSITISNLSPNTIYSVKTYITNSAGTSYGSNLVFRTSGQKTAPEVKTLTATELKNTSVILNASVKANSLITSISFEYGLTSSYGNTVIVATNIMIKNDTTVSVSLNKLTDATTYHYRVKAINAIGTTDGLDEQFITPALISTTFEIPDSKIIDVATDVSGNVYVTGTFTGTTTKLDAFVARFNSDGKLAWRKDITTNDHDYPKGGIIVVGGVIYAQISRHDIYGLLNADVYVDAYDSQTGDLKWSTKISSGKFGFSLKADENGNIFSLTSSLITVLNQNGKVINSHYFSSDAGFSDIAFINGSIYGSGNYAAEKYSLGLIRKFDQNFNSIWDKKEVDASKPSNAQSIITFPQDSLILIGLSSGSISESSSETSVACYKLRPDGSGLNLVWKKLFSTGGLQISLKKQDDKTFYVFSPDLSSAANQTSDGPLKMDLNGNIIWTANPHKNGNLATHNQKIFLTDGSSKLTVYN